MWCFVVGPSTLFAAEWVLCLESVSPRSAFWKRREVDRSNSAEATGLASRRANEHASSLRLFVPYCLNAHPSTPDHPPPVRATMSVAAPEVLDVDFLLYTDQVPDEEDHWRKRILLATAGRDPAVSFDDVIADLHGPPVIRKHYDCTITAPPRTSFVFPHPMDDPTMPGWTEVPDNDALQALVGAWDRAEPARLRAVTAAAAVAAAKELREAVWGSSGRGGGDADARDDATPAFQKRAPARSKESHMEALRLLHEIVSIPANHHALTHDVTDPVVKLLGHPDLDIRRASVDIFWLICKTNRAMIDPMILDRDIAREYISGAVYDRTSRGAGGATTVPPPRAHRFSMIGPICVFAVVRAQQSTHARLATATHTSLLTPLPHSTRPFPPVRWTVSFIPSLFCTPDLTMLCFANCWKNAESRAM